MRIQLKHLIVWCVVATAPVTNLAVAAEPPLIEAARAGHSEAVRRLAKDKDAANVQSADGTTPLHWAVHRDDLPMAEVLIRAGARINAANDLGVTPLFLACTNHNATMVKRLLSGGANPNAALLRGQTVLMECARTGDAGAVAALLAAGAKVDAAESMNQQTALMWAVAQRHPDVVTVLLEAGANIKARSRTYLQNVETGNRGGGGKDSAVPRGGSTALLFAARVGDVESARRLIVAGADVNDALPDGATALIVAAHSGQGAVGALLLDKGADPNAVSVGYTALHAAINRSDVALVTALLAHGADPNLRITKASPARRDSNDFQLEQRLVGATAYLLAAKFVETDILRALADAGADVKMTMPDGTTALMLAAGNGEARARTDFTRRNETRRQICVCDGGVVEDERQVLGAVNVITQSDSDVNAVNKAGDTALHTAAFMGFDSVVQLLAEKGADLNVKNKRGQTPLATLTRPAGGRRGAPPSEDQQNEASASTIALLRRLGAVE